MTRPVFKWTDFICIALVATIYWALTMCTASFTNCRNPIDWCYYYPPKTDEEIKTQGCCRTHSCNHSCYAIELGFKPILLQDMVANLQCIWPYRWDLCFTHIIVHGKLWPLLRSMCNISPFNEIFRNISNYPSITTHPATIHRYSM